MAESQVTFRTASSWWTIDYKMKWFYRSSVVEGAEHPNVKYYDGLTYFLSSSPVVLGERVSLILLDGKVLYSGAVKFIAEQLVFDV